MSICKQACHPTCHPTPQPAFSSNGPGAPADRTPRSLTKRNFLRLNTRGISFVPWYCLAIVALRFVSDCVSDDKFTILSYGLSPIASRMINSLSCLAVCLQLRLGWQFCLSPLHLSSTCFSVDNSLFASAFCHRQASHLTIRFPSSRFVISLFLSWQFAFRSSFCNRFASRSTIRFLPRVLSSTDFSLTIRFPAPRFVIGLFLDWQFAFRFVFFHRLASRWQFAFRLCVLSSTGFSVRFPASRFVIGLLLGWQFVFHPTFLSQTSFSVDNSFCNFVFCHWPGLLIGWQFAFQLYVLSSTCFSVDNSLSASCFVTGLLLG